MWSCVIIVLAAVEYQADADYTWRQPPPGWDDRTYVITFARGGGEAELVGFVEDPNVSPINVMEDAPWKGPAEVRPIRQQDVREIIPEGRSDRLARYDREYDALGRVRVLTANGYDWLPRQEVALAERAREMSASVEAETPAAEDPGTPPAAQEGNGPVVDEPGRPGPVRAYLPHVAIGVAAVALGALVVRFLIL
jgi:hypothetical protein